MTYIDPNKLIEDGTILLVNLAVLWPRGLALTVERNEEGATLHMQDFGEYNCVSGDHRRLVLDRVSALLDAEETRESRVAVRRPERITSG